MCYIATGSLNFDFCSTVQKNFIPSITLKIEGHWIIFYSFGFILSHCHMQKESDDASVESREIVISLVFGQQIVTEYDILSYLTLRLLMSYIYEAPILDVSRSHTTTHHSR
jgi:hypothetical protein